MEIKAGEERAFKDDIIKFGIVEKISIQGDFLYAVVRKEGTFHLNEAGQIVKEKTELFGANGTPEQMVLLAEVLIPTDILPASINVKPEFFIGKKVEVILNGNIPRIALLSRISSFAPARGMSPVDIYQARRMTTDREFSEPSKELLKLQGYEEERVTAIAKEKYIDISTKEDVLRYGLDKTWDTDLQKDANNKKRKDMTVISETKFVSGLKGEVQKSKSCYIPILSIGGKI